MRKLITLGMLCILIAYLGLGVSAVTGASAQESFATVSGDGRCQITTTVTLHLEQPVADLRFPIPADATGVTLNGSRVSASRRGDVRLLNLSRLTKNVVGDVTVSIHYSLYDVIEATDTGLQLKMPILSGFDYPVENLQFSVTLPGAVEALPGFVSGYHGARIEEDLSYTVDGATISGTSLKAMKDQETLYMTLPVTEAMFPQSITQSQDYRWGTKSMLICFLLAIAYWVLVLWNLPVFPRHCTQPPQGYHPGQAGSMLAGQGMNLSLTVLHWAQLGYISVRPQRGRVVLYKRMEMGNERTEGEMRIFQKLFGARKSVDTSDWRYAQLSRSCAKQRIGVGDMFRKWGTNSQIFRFIASGIGLFGGASLAVAMADGAALQGLLIVILAITGFFSGWYIQNIGTGLFLRNSRKRNISLACSGFWLLFGALAGDITTAFYMVAGLLLAGFLLCWGGRRTREGRRVLSELIGLRGYLGKNPQKNILLSQQDYFFSMLPWAISLGCGAQFARSFRKVKFENCDYLFFGVDKVATPLQWYRLFTQTLTEMNRRADSLPLEKFLGFVQSLAKR